MARTRNKKIKAIIDEIDDSIASFDKAVPPLQRQMFEEIQLTLKTLDVDGNGNLKATAANIRKIAPLRRKVNRIILDDEYLLTVNGYLKSFNGVTKLYDDYFKTVVKDYTRPSNIKVIKNEAILEAKNALTEAGIEGNITNPVATILKEEIESRSSFANLNQRVRDFMTNNSKGKGQLDKYTDTIVTDFINTYGRSYGQQVVADLDLKWFRYVGSLISDSRPWCVKMVEKQWVHISELKTIVHAFPLNVVPLNKRTALPQGMKGQTNGKNVTLLCGGWKCRHQFMPVSEFAVPQEIRDLFPD